MLSTLVNMLSYHGRRCFVFHSAGGGTLSMQECSSSVESSDGRSVFSTTASGQLKMPRLGNYCLTISGDGVDKRDIGASADVSATSSSAQHMASSIIDGSADSHWASGFDPSSAVDVLMDFGAAKIVESVSIEWEHPPLVSKVILCVLGSICWFDSAQSACSASL